MGEFGTSSTCMKINSFREGFVLWVCVQFFLEETLFEIGFQNLFIMEPALRYSEIYWNFKTWCITNNINNISDNISNNGNTGSK